jgi:hypothetical protein
MHGKVYGLAGWNLTVETRADFGKISCARICQVGPDLKITRILGGQSVHPSGIRGRNDVTRIRPIGEVLEEALYRFGKLIELDGTVNDRLHAIQVERFVVGQEDPGACNVGFGLFINSRVNRVVGTLKQELFAVCDKFDARVRVLGSR